MDLRIDEVEMPLVVCDHEGRIEAKTTRALSLLRRFQMIEEGNLVPHLWTSLEETPLDEALEWRSPEAPAGIVECTRYRTGDHFLLLMKETSEQHFALSQRLHRQRMETTGRLMASIAHELRGSVAGVVYSVDLLGITAPSDEANMKDALKDCKEACSHLQQTLDHLLAYARTGMAPALPVSLSDVLTRAQGFLRGFYSKGAHRLDIQIPRHAEWVRGNSLAVEQIFVNLLINAAEAAKRSLEVSVTSELASLGDDPRPMVCVRVRDNGPGVPPPLRATIFQPFFTTRDDGTGLGLTNAVEAVNSMDGHLVLEESDGGASFAVYLPHCVVSGAADA